MQYEKDFSELWKNKEPVQLSKFQLWVKSMVSFYQNLLKKPLTVQTAKKEPEPTPEQSRKADFVNNCLTFHLEDELIKLLQDGYVFSTEQSERWNAILKTAFWQNKETLFKKLDAANIPVKSDFYYQEFQSLKQFSLDSFIRKKKHTSYFQEKINAMYQDKDIYAHIHNELDKKLNDYEYMVDNYDSLNEGKIPREKSEKRLKNLYEDLYFPLYQFEQILIKGKTATELFILSNRLKKIDTLMSKISASVHMSNTSVKYCRNDIFKLIEEELKKPKAKEEMKVFHTFGIPSVKAMLSQEKQIELNYNQLPKDAQEKIVEIEKIYNLLIKESLQDYEKEQFNKLWEANIKQTIVDYLRLGHEFKATMRNAAGQSADDLLLLTLDEYLQIFKQKFETLNEEYFRKISVNARFATMKNKGV